MTLSRRQLGLMLGGAVLPVIGRAQADSYPQRPIKIVVPFGPGSAVDVVARLTAPRMTQSLGQPLVIDDRPGATGAIGAYYVAKSPPNGYTLVLGTVASHATLAATQPDLPYNIERDFEPIALLTNSWTIVVVNPSVPATNLKEFAAWTKAQSKPVNYASAGIGGVTHLAAELVRLRTGANLNHIPYRDAAQGITDTIAGQVSMMIYPAAVIPHIRSGELRALAVLAPKRLPALPDVSTGVEQGFPDLLASGWQGLFAPAKTPIPVRDRVAAAIHDTVTDPEISAKLVAQGFDPDPDSTPANFARFVADEIAKWQQIVHSPGVQI
jgi:tripartite-type tricarboxylate transporter receptor subunit TctC